MTLAGLVGADAEGAQLREALHAKGVSPAGPARRARPADDQQDPHPLRGPAAAPAAGPRRRPRRLRRAPPRTCCGGSCPWSTSRPRSCWPTTRRGSITPALARAVIDRCRQRGIPCVVDPKKADFAAYARATVVTPNLLEAERAAGRPLAGNDGGGRTPPTRCGPRWSSTPC